MPARHVVVDGSNIATEGSSLPSLVRLDQAVREFLAENPDDIVTVVVDATFGHRIPAEEREMFEQAELDGDIVSPPAGAIGRGDAFLLRVADKTGAVVLSNDSFQEFHGEYEWLFDKGRLIGGKPVPGVGWIFTPRSPVRGPKSREAVKEAKRRKRAEKVEEQPEGGLVAAERSRHRPGERKLQRAIAVAVEEAVAPGAPAGPRRRRRRGKEKPSEPVNEPLAFISFIAEHQLGSEVDAMVEEFSSHGAFVSVGEARCYVPLSAMGDPPPRSAREVLHKGELFRFVVQAFDAMRRGVELAMPGFAHPAGAPTEETIEAEIEHSHQEEPGPAGKRTRRAPALSKAAVVDASGDHVAKRVRRREDGAPAQVPRARKSAAQEHVVDLREVEPSEVDLDRLRRTPGPRTRLRPATSDKAAEPVPRSAKSGPSAAKELDEPSSAGAVKVPRTLVVKKAGVKKPSAKKVAPSKAAASEVAAKKVAVVKGAAAKVVAEKVASASAVGAPATKAAPVSKRVTKKSAAPSAPVKALSDARRSGAKAASPTGDPVGAPVPKASGAKKASPSVGASGKAAAKAPAAKSLAGVLAKRAAVKPSAKVLSPAKASSVKAPPAKTAVPGLAGTAAKKVAGARATKRADVEVSGKGGPRKVGATGGRAVAAAPTSTSRTRTTRTATEAKAVVAAEVGRLEETKAAKSAVLPRSPRKATKA